MVMGTKFDYDLNIYRLEEQVGLDADAFPIYEYTDQWYVDIYEHLGGDQVHVAGPFPITAQQRDLLKCGVEGTYFYEDDAWYGMWGFLDDYQAVLLPELASILTSLPKFKEEVLF
jgi:hypothetical protein